MGRNLTQRHQNEKPLVQARVWNDESGFADLAIVKEQNVQIQ
jgi:hypothetical protein